MKIVLPEDRPRYEFPLPGGQILTLSPVIKTDRAFFEQGLRELSIDSRFSRFGQGVASLSERELAYLTDVDQRSHVAWGALVGEDAAGVGRYILTSDSSAEFAITVLDSMQGIGVGTALLIALVAVARADGIEELWFEARADNAVVKRLLAEIEVGQQLVEGTIERRIRLSDMPHSPHESGLRDVIYEVRT